MLGIGIDEDIVAVLGEEFEVIGSGGVDVVDGTGLRYCDVAEASTDCALSMHVVRVHLLSSGDRFNLETREPRRPD